MDQKEKEKTETLGSTRALATPVRSTLKEIEMDEAPQPNDMEDDKTVQQPGDLKGPEETEVTHATEIEEEKQGNEMAGEPEEPKGPTKTEVTNATEIEEEKQGIEFVQEPANTKGPTGTEVPNVNEMEEETMKMMKSNSLIKVNHEDGTKNESTPVVIVDETPRRDSTKEAQKESKMQEKKRLRLQSGLQKRAPKAMALKPKTPEGKAKAKDKTNEASKAEASEPGASGEISARNALKPGVRTACKAKAKAKRSEGSTKHGSDAALKRPACKAKAKAKSHAGPTTLQRKAKAKAKRSAVPQATESEPSAPSNPATKAKAKAKVAKRSAEDMEKNERPEKTEESTEKKMEESEIKKKLHSVFRLCLFHLFHVFLHVLYGGSILLRFTQWLGRKQRQMARRARSAWWLHRQHEQSNLVGKGKQKNRVKINKHQEIKTGRVW